MKTYTLAELGSRLPIGVHKEGGLMKSFELRPFKTQIDRHLSTWIKTNSEKYDPLRLEACQITKLLSMTCSMIGDTSWNLTDKGDSTPEQEIAIYGWHYADVMYMYIYLRRSAMGDDMAVALACPNVGCGFSDPNVTFDLSTLDVHTIEDMSEMYKWVNLKYPFKLQNGITLKTVRVGPILWSTFCKPGVLDSTVGSVDLISMQDSICGINGSEESCILTSTDIDEMHKFDRTMIGRHTDEVNAGPDVRTIINCPDCNFPIVNPLNWTYENFFVHSLPLGT